MRDLSTAQASYLPTPIETIRVGDWIEHGHLDDPGYGEVIAVYRDDEAEIFEVEVRVPGFDYDCWPYNRTGRYHVVAVDLGCSVRGFVPEHSDEHGDMLNRALAEMDGEAKVVMRDGQWTTVHATRVRDGNGWREEFRDVVQNVRKDAA